MKAKFSFLSLILITFFAIPAHATNPILSCIKGAGLDEIQVAAELGDPSCSSQYALPLFDALAGGIVTLSVGGSSDFQSSSACSQLPYNAAGSAIAGLIYTVVPGLGDDTKGKLELIAKGKSKALISQVLPPEVLASFMLPWKCACRFADLKKDFLQTANDASNCVSGLANLLGPVAEDVGTGIEKLGGPIYHNSGCVMCATNPVYACGASNYSVSSGNCACQAPRVVDANGNCGCPGNALFFTGSVGMPDYCVACVTGKVADHSCQTTGSSCGVSCGPGSPLPGSCTCGCPKNSQLTNSKTTCECMGGYDPDFKHHECICKAPKIIQGLNGEYCTFPDCPGKLQFHDKNGVCGCPSNMNVTSTAAGCACKSGTLSKDSICCKQLASDGTCLIPSDGSTPSGICPAGQYYEVPPKQLKGKCAYCPSGKVPNASQSACVTPAPGSRVPPTVQPK